MGCGWEFVAAFCGGMVLVLFVNTEKWVRSLASGVGRVHSRSMILQTTGNFSHEESARNPLPPVLSPVGCM